MVGEKINITYLIQMTLKWHLSLLYCGVVPKVMHTIQFGGGGGEAGTGMKLRSLYKASAVCMHAILESFSPVSPHNKNF